MVTISESKEFMRGSDLLTSDAVVGAACEVRKRQSRSRQTQQTCENVLLLPFGFTMPWSWSWSWSPSCAGEREARR